MRQRWLLGWRKDTKLTELVHLSDVSGSEPLLAAFVEEGLDVWGVRVEVTLGNGVAGDGDLAPRIRTVGDPVVALFPVDQADLESYKKKCELKLQILIGQGTNKQDLQNVTCRRDIKEVKQQWLQG